MSKGIDRYQVGTNVTIVMDGVQTSMGLLANIAKAVERSEFILARHMVLPIFYICDIMYVIMAKKNNTKRKLVGLVSEESGVRAYYTKKNTMNTPDKLSLKKYDPVLRKHVLFVETKKNLGRNEVKEKKR